MDQSITQMVDTSLQRIKEMADVNIIIGCAINDTPAETMMLTNFMNIINIPEFNQKLLLASDKKEIIDIIRHYEQRHVAIKNKSFE